MKKCYKQYCDCETQLSSIDPEIVSILLDAVESSRLRTDKFMESHYPRTRVKDSFWKSYFQKQ